MKINNKENLFEYDGETYPLFENTDITEEELTQCVRKSEELIKELVETTNGEQ